MVSAFSIPQSKRDQKSPQNPGPGQYNPQNTPKITKKKDPQYSMGKQKKDLFHQNGVPGPGSYQLKNNAIQQPPGYSFGARTKLVEDKINLGPGSYLPKYSLKEGNSPSFSFKGRSSSVSGTLVPGPGNYEPYKSSVVVDHVAKFGRQKRDFSMMEKFPGPGSYQYREAFDRYAMKNDPQYKFGSRIPQLKPSFVPGPGSYRAQKQIYSKIGGIMSRDMRFLMEKSIDLGPGQYNAVTQRIKKTIPSFSLSKSKRDLIKQSQVPGPGKYDSPQSYKKLVESGPNYHFPKEERLRMSNIETPGPGSYQQKTQLGSKKIYIPQKVKLPQNFNVPGPGSYEIKQDLLTKNIKYSLHKRPQINYENKVPGPGSYLPKQNTFNTQAYGFGSDQRLKLKASQVPGPGSYQLKSPFADVPKYLMKQK